MKNAILIIIMVLNLCSCTVFSLMEGTGDVMENVFGYEPNHPFETVDEVVDEPEPMATFLELITSHTDGVNPKIKIVTLDTKLASEETRIKYNIPDNVDFSLVSDNTDKRFITLIFKNSVLKNVSDPRVIRDINRREHDFYYLYENFENYYIETYNVTISRNYLTNFTDRNFHFFILRHNGARNAFFIPFEIINAFLIFTK